MRTIFLLFLAHIAFAGTVEIGRDAKHKANIITYSDKYSLKSFVRIDLSSAKDLNGQTIYASHFAREVPDTHVFPDDMLGVTFVRCHLENVYVPPGNILIDCWTTRYKVQNDLRDWEIDSENKPVKLINEEKWKDEGYSIDAKDIPAQKISDISEIKKAEPVAEPKVAAGLGILAASSVIGLAMARKYFKEDVG